ncbi:MAG: SurA N-terminal domain-containing protein [Aestuariivita sp.]|nr:SurA N-terminal domain-containing protein [Aestuariivita sp.]
MSARSRLSKTFVWVLLGLLFAGLAGFGATNLSGTVRTVGKAGDQLIGVDQFARELQREMSAIASQTGNAVSISRAQELGLHRLVLSRLSTIASMDFETTKLGISIGDENLQEDITNIEAFEALDGTFDRDAYRLSLQSAGLNEADFENDLRNEAARILVRDAVIEGTVMPDTMVNLIIEYIGAQRSFTWANLGVTDVELSLEDPTNDELRAFYENNLNNYFQPETKEITFARLYPTDLLDNIIVEEATLSDAYKAQSEKFNQPERRLLERLVFIDETTASVAKKQIDDGETTFEQLVEDRGLILADIDLGDVSASDLGDSADAIFAAPVGSITGPYPTELGPALFRVNGFLEEQSTSFEEALPVLRDELARASAQRRIESLSQNFEDLLAAGATLEELVEETEMTLGKIRWHQNTFDDIAAYETFRQVARDVTKDDFPEIQFFDDGGVFALRLDEHYPASPEPFENVLTQVQKDYQRNAQENALTKQAKILVDDITVNTDFADIGLEGQTERNLTRTDFIDGAPLDMMEQVFQMIVGEVRIIPNAGEVVVIRLDDVKSAETTGELANLYDSLQAQLNQALGQELLSALVEDIQVRTDPQIDERAVSAVMSSFQ